MKPTADPAAEADRTTLYRQRMARIAQRFMDGLDDRLAALEALLRQVEREPSASAAHCLYRGLHEIAGTAPTLGLTELGAHAGALEQIVRPAVREPALLTEPDIARLRAGLSDMAALASQSRETLK